MASGQNTDRINRTATAEFQSGVEDFLVSFAALAALHEMIEELAEELQRLINEELVRSRGRSLVATE